jgi:hypothetical protein
MTVTVRLTEDEIAERIGWKVSAVRTMLEESEQDGVVERVGDGEWMLSAAAEGRLGFALRTLEPR